VQLSNIELIDSVTPLVSKGTGWLKAAVLRNIAYIVVTAPVCQPANGSLKVSSAS
jgi:hypothetical protein